MGRRELNARHEEARRRIDELGITYNVYADSQGMERPWDLDLVPLLIPAHEWRRIEAGLSQRTRLLNLILQDLYGPQQLLKDGLIPPALVYANPAFARPCHGVRVPMNIRLFLHAVDLARSPDGQWWALSDRTQAPSGIGYVLENRIVLSGILPDQFRDCQVQRLASFFQQERDALRRLAPQGQDQPNIVLLSPGPHNETYFEHSYRARYLGFTLVEGSDLTVRDRRVYLKTLDGLQQVDVILRRVDDMFCDPLELRADSFLGVPGLVEAVRTGNVAVANSLGSGLVESSALAAFLPRLCRHLLDEDLKMPSVATWWCGQPRELDYVIDNLDHIVVKRAYTSEYSEPFFGDRLSKAGKADLVAALRAAPHAFVGQEQVALSTAPTWVNSQMAPRPLVLRTYTAYTGDDCAVMPGGLTRVSHSPEDLVVSMQRGGASKDTWVMSDEPVHKISLLRSSEQTVVPGRTAAEVPSRVADSLFWLGRYAERLEHTLRLLRTALRQLSGEASAEQTPQRSALLKVLAELELLPPSVGPGATLAEAEREILSLVYNTNREESVRSLVTRIRQIASTARDRFSADSWRIFARLQSDARVRPRQLPVADALELVETLIVDLAAFSGFEAENMTRGHGWRFLAIGRRLERAINVTQLVRASLEVDPKGDTLLESVLEIADSAMTYRGRYFAQPQLPTASHLLLLEKANPRSLLFQLDMLSQHAAALPADRSPPELSQDQWQIALICERLHDTNLLEFCASTAEDGSPELMNLLDTIADELQAFSVSLAQQYFSHTATQVS
jgi:uncharacterized circularly permuted ATP-grasp superfamily protein/uncharacterized alpha-E superfamily protein